MFSRRSICAFTLAGILAVLAPAVMAQAAEKATGTIKVTVRGCSSDAGHVRIALNHAKQGFDTEDDFRAAVVSIRDHTATHVFENIPYGTYAVRLFHDANDNGELDTNVMGIPTEAYGFSNNARGRMGPPSFEEAAFVLDTDSLALTINVR